MNGLARCERGRDYVSSAYNSAIKQSPNLQGVKLVHSQYQDLEIPPNSIIYCDPPYRDTATYKTGKFNHDSFWLWCEQKHNEGHTVFVSEYQAPNSFRCIWEKVIVSSFDTDANRKRATERLFVYRNATIAMTPLEAIVMGITPFYI